MLYLGMLFPCLLLQVLDQAELLILLLICDREKKFYNDVDSRGEGDFGRLGHGDSQSRFLPTRVKVSALWAFPM